MSVFFRDAVISDVPVLVRLASQLGYQVEADIAADRIRHITGDNDERVIVAVENGLVVGWTTCKVETHLHNTPAIRISGFVVEKESRRKGIGRHLMLQVENWAHSRKIATIRLSANAARVEAHQFYEAVGFKKMKVQYAFEKVMRE